MKLGVSWRPEAAQRLSRLPWAQRKAIERAVEALRVAPDDGHCIENVCGGFRETIASGYRVFCLTRAGRVEVTGLRRAWPQSHQLLAPARLPRPTTPSCSVRTAQRVLTKLEPYWQAAPGVLVRASQVC